MLSKKIKINGIIVIHQGFVKILMNCAKNSRFLSRNAKNKFTKTSKIGYNKELCKDFDKILHHGAFLNFFKKFLAIHLKKCIIVGIISVLCNITLGNVELGNQPCTTAKASFLALQTTIFSATFKVLVEISFCLNFCQHRIHYSLISDPFIREYA